MAEFPVTKPQFIVPSCVNLSTFIQGMSDYEVRCYYTQLVQQWATEWAQMQTEWTSQQQAFEDFKTYVNGQIAKFQSWFDNLDVQNEINNKIDEMANSGELLDIIQGTVTSSTESAVDKWLGENMTPGAGAPALDSSFTLKNAAAQAKAVGDKCIQRLESQTGVTDAKTLIKPGIYPVSINKLTDGPSNAGILQNSAFLIVVGGYSSPTQTTGYILQILVCAYQGYIPNTDRATQVYYSRFVNMGTTPPSASPWSTPSSINSAMTATEENRLDLNDSKFMPDGTYALGATNTRAQYIDNLPETLIDIFGTSQHNMVLTTKVVGNAVEQILSINDTQGFPYCAWVRDLNTNNTYASQWQGLSQRKNTAVVNVPFDKAYEFSSYYYTGRYEDPSAPPDDGKYFINGEMQGSYMLRVTRGFTDNNYVLQELFCYDVDRTVTPNSITPQLIYQRMLNAYGTGKAVYPWKKMYANSVPGYEKLSGLKFSVLGDSISTFQGIVPSGYAYFYPIGDVTQASQMWWDILAKNTGMQRLKIAAWSGSSCHGNGTSTTNASAGCSTARVNALKNGDTVPDIVICYIGINDFGPENTPVGDWLPKNNIPEDSSNVATFSKAYCIMVDKIMKTYPKARVFCCTLVNTGRETKDQVEPNVYPTKNNAGVTLDQYNDVIKNVAWGLGCDIIDLHACGITFHNQDVYTGPNRGDDPSVHGLLHPNAAGQELLAKKIIAEINAKY